MVERAKGRETSHTWGTWARCAGLSSVLPMLHYRPSPLCPLPPLAPERAIAMLHEHLAAARQYLATMLLRET